MSGIKVTWVMADGTEKTVENINPGESLMEVARANGVTGILGDCGGGCACATCHVYVDPAWQAAVGEADDIELSALDMVGDSQKPSSRLSCQITARSELDGLRLSVAPWE